MSKMSFEGHNQRSKNNLCRFETWLIMILMESCPIVFGIPFLVIPLKFHGPLARYVILRVAHAPGMRGAFPPPPRLAIPTCITARAWRTCRDACRDRWLAISFEVGDGENVPCIRGTCAIRNFAYLVRGPWSVIHTNIQWPLRYLSSVYHRCRTL